MSGRKALVATACAAGAAVLITGGVLVVNAAPQRAEADSVAQTVKTATATVEKGDLKGTTTKTGKVAGTPGAKVPGGPAGTLTSIPEVGTVVKPGDVLYRVDDQPVVYFAGALPQWRAFEAGMSDGPDVQQLEENLHAWGYLASTPNSRFDWRTRAAVQKWQKATGQPQTGTIDLGRIWFGEGEQIVADRPLSVGDRVAPGSPVFSTTGTVKVVTVDLPVGSTLAKVGGIVSIRLPAGGSVPGKVTALGNPVTDEDGKTTTPVTVSFDDPKKAADLDKVEVSVEFVSETRTDVLSVPVTALGARAGGGFVVEVAGKAGATREVKVTTGLFAGDRVEVKGDLKPGEKVVVPA